MAKKTNCTKGGKNYFRVTKVVGHKPDGTAIRKEFYAESKKDAEEKANEYMRKLKNGFANDFEKITVNQLFNKWLFSVKIYSVRPATFVKYEGDYRLYIKNSDFSNQPVISIKKNQVQSFYNKLFEVDKKSNSKIKAIHKLLYSFFEYAIDDGYIEKNPCIKVVIPKNAIETHEDGEIYIFTQEEINNIKKACIGNKFESLFFTAIYTGMRLGELFALKWDNIDLDNGIIKINQSIKYTAVFQADGTKKHERILGKPKTNNSNREIYIPNILIEKLKNTEKVSEFVFTNFGEPITPKALYTQWIKILDEANVTYRKFHTLRHTYASTLLLNGVDLKTVQDLVGHGDMKITQIYLHSLPDNKKKAVNIFDTL